MKKIEKEDLAERFNSLPDTNDHALLIISVEDNQVIGFKGFDHSPSDEEKIEYLKELIAEAVQAGAAPNEGMLAMRFAVAERVKGGSVDIDSLYESIAAANDCDCPACTAGRNLIPKKPTVH